MKIFHIQAMCLFLLVARAAAAQPSIIHPLNQKGHEPLRMIQSDYSSRSLVRNRTQSVFNCYGSTCILNEEFCDGSKQGCAKCRYENNICTKDLDCFNFCSEKATEEICKAREGSTETVNISWLPFVLIILFVVSFTTNVFCIIKLRKHITWKCKRDEPERRVVYKKRANDRDENSELLSEPTTGTHLNIEEKGQVPKETNVNQKMEPARDLEPTVQRGPKTHPEDNSHLYPTID